jgi:hypothetical protein
MGAKEDAFIGSEILVFEVQRIISAGKPSQDADLSWLASRYQSTTSETFGCSKRDHPKFQRLICQDEIEPLREI